MIIVKTCAKYCDSFTRKEGSRRWEKKNEEEEEEEEEEEKMVVLALPL